MDGFKYTTSLRCRKCEWCSRWDNYDPNRVEKRWWTYYCTLPDDSPAIKGKAPTLDDSCPYFKEPATPIDILEENK